MGIYQDTTQGRGRFLGFVISHKHTHTHTHTHACAYPGECASHNTEDCPYLKTLYYFGHVNYMCIYSCLMVRHFLGLLNEPKPRLNKEGRKCLCALCGDEWGIEMGQGGVNRREAYCHPNVQCRHLYKFLPSMHTFLGILSTCSHNLEFCEGEGITLWT